MQDACDDCDNSGQMQLSRRLPNDDHLNFLWPLAIIHLLARSGEVITGTQQS